MNQREHLLSCLSEECAEVAKRVSKALRFGLTEIEPGQSFSNAERIVFEFYDLLAIMSMLEETGCIELAESDALNGFVDKKKAKVKSFMKYARECKALD